MGDAELLPAGPFEVAVSVRADHAINDVASALVAAGLEDPEVLTDAGVITGTVGGPGIFASVREVAGVEAAEVSRTIQLPPPDEPIQ
jgi:hypothetical protein